MKRTTIDGKVFIVKTCKDCPFISYDEDDYFCNHHDARHWGHYIMDTGVIDSGCPLADYEGDCKEELEEPKKSELLPCPFCGASARLEDYPEGWNVYCNNLGVCGIRTGWIRVTRERAIEIWNRRVNE